MSDWVSLTPQEIELFMFTIETSVKVTKRFQFFLWAQGTLQTFLPHETLVCGLGDATSARCRFETFSRAVMDETAQAALCQPLDGPVAQLARHWHEAGQEPILVRGGRDDPLSQALTRHGIDSALCHGVRDLPTERGSFFAFLRINEGAPARYAYLAELLMPHLHLSLARMCEHERAEDPIAVPLDDVLSDREKQVLQWVREGKTNHEIGHILEISPLTVKNHVQKILRKLNVTNRAQAVAKGVRAGLFRSAEQKDER